MASSVGWKITAFFANAAQLVRRLVLRETVVPGASAVLRDLRRRRRPQRPRGVVDGVLLLVGVVVLAVGVFVVGGLQRENWVTSEVRSHESISHQK